MIDEKKLIEEMECIKSELKQNVYGWYPVDFADVISYIKEFPKVGEWIPCSERLPEEDETSEYYDAVIVTLDDGRVACGCYRNRDKEWWVDAEDGEKYSINATGHVVAWVPLPESYKEGDSNGESQTT